MILERIKSLVPISRLANTTKTRISCPFHMSKDLDMSLNHSNNTWRCFGKCGHGGDVIEWMKFERPELNFNEIIEHLANIAGVSTKPPEERTRILTKAMESFREELLENQQAQEFLLTRGITEETWFKANIGFCNGIPNGISMKDLKASGLVTEHNYTYFDKRIVFALHNSAGQIVHLQGRTLGLDLMSDRKYLMLPSETALGKFPISHYIYGEEQLSKPIKTAVLCEGIPDALIARQLGVPSFGTIGNQGFHIHGYKLKDLETLFIIMDNDESSQTKLCVEVHKLQAKMPNTQLKIVYLPKASKDLNEWYLNTQATPSSFQYLLETSSKLALEVLIDSWSSNRLMHYQLVETLASTNNSNYWFELFSKTTNISIDSIRYLASVIKGH